MSGSSQVSQENSEAQTNETARSARPRCDLAASPRYLMIGNVRITICRSRVRLWWPRREWL
jgi:hypothetical protein